MDLEKIAPIIENILKKTLEQKRYPFGFAKLIVGEAREKYASLPGPQGGTQLNGATLKGEAKAEMEKLEQELKDFVDGSMPLGLVIG